MSAKITTTVSFEVTKGIDTALRKATEQAFAQMAGELTGRFDDAISGSYWPWPRTTPRFGGGRNLADAAAQWKAAQGSGVSSPRSIVDSGALKQSRDFNLDLVGLKAEWNWNVDYAAAVHEGAFINPFGNQGKTVQLPARPWTQAVLQGNTEASGIPIYPVAANLKKYITQRTG